MTTTTYPLRCWYCNGLEPDDQTTVDVPTDDCQSLEHRTVDIHFVCLFNYRQELERFI